MRMPVWEMQRGLCLYEGEEECVLSGLVASKSVGASWRAGG